MRRSFQAIADPFFGEREAIKKLALWRRRRSDDRADHSATLFDGWDAQPITLAPLVVPDTDL